MTKDEKWRIQASDAVGGGDGVGPNRRFTEELPEEDPGTTDSDRGDEEGPATGGSRAVEGPAGGLEGGEAPPLDPGGDEEGVVD